MSYLESPPNLTGTAQQQLVQMRSYLYRLSEALSVALNQVSSGGTGGTMGRPAAAGSVSAADSGGSGFVTLRDLIVKTAEIVTVAKDEITRTLESNYVAQSAFGMYQSQIETTLTATAEELAAKFQLMETTIDGELSAIRTSMGYIKAGFITEDAEKKIVGIAIGQTVTLNNGSTHTEHETEYQEIDLGATQNCAFYTADGLYFYVNGIQMAYLTNQRMHIVDGEIDNTLTFGNDKWLINHAYGGFSIKWIGG